ncbi:response regulator transcription factor [Planctomycetota bacterium]
MQDSISRIFIVDDDEYMQSIMCALLKSHKYECICFSNANECFKKLNKANEDYRQGCDLLITDLKMPEKDGLELLDEVKSMMPWLPVVIMSAYGDISMSVKALKTGAFDFIEKPINEEKLIKIVESALLRDSAWKDRLQGKPLTRAERIVLRLIMEGIGNKRIAYILERSERTIEVHRSRIMRKLGVDNVVDLVKRATTMGWGD